MEYYECLGASDAAAGEGDGTAGALPGALPGVVTGATAGTVMTLTARKANQDVNGEGDRAGAGAGDAASAGAGVDGAPAGEDGATAAGAAGVGAGSAFATDGIPVFPVTKRRTPKPPKRSFMRTQKLALTTDERGIRVREQETPSYTRICSRTLMGCFAPLPSVSSRVR